MLRFLNQILKNCIRKYLAVNSMSDFMLKKSSKHMTDIKINVVCGLLYKLNIIYIFTL